MGTVVVDEGWVLFGEARSGAVAVEAALTLLGAPYRVIETTTSDPAGSPGTPMGQAPTLVLPGHAATRGFAPAGAQPSAASAGAASETAVTLAWAVDRTRIDNNVNKRS